jgi:hypothetical protein
MIPVAMIFFIPFMIAAPLMEHHPDLGIALMAAGGIIYVLLMLALPLLTYPVMLRSALTMDFKSGFSWSFVKSFVGKAGLSLFGYCLLLVLMAIPLTFVGYLALIVGAYVVAAWMQFALFHLLFQHYDLYLERGGERIEVNPLVTRNLGYLQPPPPLPPSVT